jgi:hypothetical protein
MTDFNDSLDNLFAGDTGPVRVAPVRADAVEFKSAEQRFEENCPKCRGTGRFVGYTGKVFGQCFTCKGKGKFQFKTSPETRAANRAASADRKVAKVREWQDGFKQAEPEVWAWINEECDRFPFAAKMLEGIATYGSLTEGQLAACRRLVEAAKARKEERTQRLASAPQVASEGVDRLKAAFDKAIAFSAAKGLKLSPRITVDGMTISPAKADSKNPGALYVKGSDRTYLGKIADGQFFPSRECGEVQKTKVLAFVADPAEAAKVYGQTSGTCCICNATLISKWKHRGIGPICAEKFGW